MDNGEIILTVSLERHAPNTTAIQTPAVTFSEDQGDTWSPFKEIPPVKNRPTMLTYLGAGNLSLYGTAYFSSDYGKTWSIEGPVDQHYSANEGNPAVDRDANGQAVRVMEIGHNYDAQIKWPTGLPLEGFRSSFRYSLDKGHTWSAPITPPTWTFKDTFHDQSYTWGTSEGSVVRATNGWLVAALRTDPPSRFTVPGLGNDNLDGTAASISKDNGLTWSPLNRLFDSGRHHADLRLLPNGDLLMTMIVREDMQFGSGLISNVRGEDALISHDNGLTWNLDHRITVDAFSHDDPGVPQSPQDTCGHIATAVLSDGSVLTAYGNYLDSAAVMTKWNPAAIQNK